MSEKRLREIAAPGGRAGQRAAGRIAASWLTSARYFDLVREMNIFAPLRNNRLLDCWARLERRPLNTPLEFLIRREHRLEGKRKLRWTMGIEMGETFLRLVNGRNVAYRNPPHRNVGSRKFFKPCLALAKQFSVGGVIEVALESFHGLPH